MIGRVLALVLLLGRSALAQAPVEQVAFDLSTPRRALHVYLSACRAGDYETASRVLDLSRIPPRDREVRGEALAARFKRVLDRTLWFDLESVSDSPDGDLEDGLPPYQDRLGSIAASGAPLEVVLKRTEGAWKFPDAIVARIPALYEEFGYGALGEWLPAPFFEWRALEIYLWQWLGLIALALLSAALSRPCARLLLAAARPVASRIAPLRAERSVRSALSAARLGLAVAIFAAALHLLALSVPAQAFFLDTARVLLVIAAAKFAFGIIDLALAAVGERMLARERQSAVAVLPAVGRVSKSALGVLAFLLTLQGLGFNVTAALAGLGVGGIAVALAAQRTLENLFGGLTLIADQPVRVGDFCRFGEKLGTVEDIGLRSTRVRTLDRTVVTIPNADFSRMELENYAKRDRIWYNPRLGLRYETSPEQIRYLLVEIRRLLYAHPRVAPDGARVRFVGFGESSLDLDVFAYVNTSDYADFLEVAEDLNLRIMDIVGAAGSGFAFPSQTVYVEQGEGLDRERARSAEAEVARWRDARQLYLPGFPQSEIERMRFTLEYPSSGSPQAAGSPRRISV